MEIKQLDINPGSLWLYHTPSELGKGFPFYITESGFFSGNESYFTERDCKNSYLMLYTLSGTGSLLYKGQPFELKAGQVALINCNFPHRYNTLNTPWQFYWVHFNGAAAPHYELLINDAGLTPINILNSQDYLQLTHKLHALLKQHDAHTDLKASLYITELLTLLVYNHKAPQNQRAFSFQQELQRSITYIQDNYASDLSIEIMAEVAHISKFHFMRLFKQYMGISPFDYLIHYRITMSKALLHDNNLSIQGISEAVGYKNVNNFIRNFKKLVGETPHQYRINWKV